MLLTGILFAFSNIGAEAKDYETDVIPTSAGGLEITFIGHGTLMFSFAGKIIHIDPFGQLGDYDRLPKADFILITHEHQDHLDLKAVGKVRTGSTIIIASGKAAQQIKGAEVMHNGEAKAIGVLKIEAVPAYNLVHMRSPGLPFHPRGIGNGYVITFGDKRVYVAGDTENIPEMRDLKDIDVAFLPMNLPYTMTPEMAVDAAKAFNPKILYPYHYGDSDPGRLKTLLGDSPRIEVRIRNMR
jgi:L-ascorbate metabolism protein UlaG (beta-lactamase superfamily)